MQTPPQQYDTRPWYRYPWPWVLIAIPFSAVLFGIVMVYSTGVYRDDLVSDSYYKDGMAINRTLEKDAKATALDIHAQISRPENNVLALTISGAEDSVIELQLSHVNDSSRDLTMLLHPDKTATTADSLRYTGASEAVSRALRTPGVWYIQLQGIDTGWRLRQRMKAPINQLDLNAS